MRDGNNGNGQLRVDPRGQKRRDDTTDPEHGNRCNRTRYERCHEQKRKIQAQLVPPESTFPSLISSVARFTTRSPGRRGPMTRIRSPLAAPSWTLTHSARPLFSRITISVPWWKTSFIKAARWTLLL